MWSIIVIGSLTISLAKIPRASPTITDGSTVVKVTTYISNVLATSWLVSGLPDSEMRKAGRIKAMVDVAPNSARRFSPKAALTKTPIRAQMSKI